MDVNNNVDLTYKELLTQKKKLTEELKKSKEEKDYILKLWKENQSENPNTVNIINKVIEKEQEKADAKDLKVLMIFEQKDKQLTILQEVNGDLQNQLTLTEEKLSQQYDTVSSLQNRINDAQSEIEHVKKQLAYKDNLLETNDKQLTIFEDNIKDLESKNIELLQENNVYQNNIDALNERLETASEQTENLKNEFEQFKNDFDEKDKELKYIATNLENEMKKNQELIAELNEKDNKLNMIMEALSEKCKEVDDLNKTVHIKSDKILAKKQSIQKLSHQLEACKNDVVYLKEQIRSYENYPKQLNDQVQLIEKLEKLQDESQHVLSQQEVSHQKEISTYQKNIFELKGNIKKLQEELTSIMSEIKKLQKTNYKMEGAFDELKQKENSLQQEVVSLALELEATRSELNQKSFEGQQKDNQDEYTNTDCESLNNMCTQTSPMKAKHKNLEVETQTENYLLDEFLQISLKAKKKEKKLHSENQCLLSLNSEIIEENETLKRSISLVESQCRELSDMKTKLETDVSVLQLDNRKLQNDVLNAELRLQATTDMLKERSKQLEDCAIELKTMSANQVKENIATTKLKSTEDELQVAVTNCAKLSFQLKTLCGENEILMEKQKSFQERITKLEKQLNQKKALIDEMKTKNNELKNDLEKKSDNALLTNKKLKSLTEREAKDKVYIEKLKSKMDDIIEEKSSIEEFVGKLENELRRKEALLLEAQHLCDNAQSAITTIENSALKQMNGKLIKFETREGELISRCNKSISRVKEHKLVLKSFVDSLLTLINERHQEQFLTLKDKDTKHGDVKDIYKKKACDVACNILNLSTSGLAEFMNVDTVLNSSSHKYEDKDIREKLTLILDKKDNFEKVTSRFLLDLVDYYKSLFIS